MRRLACLVQPAAEMPCALGRSDENHFIFPVPEWCPERPMDPALRWERPLSVSLIKP